MNPAYVDAHCHLQFAQYDEDREILAEKMQSEGIAGIAIGCDLESSKKAVELAGKYDHIYASIGLHPNHEGDEWYDAKHYRELARSSKVVAIGECGLDYYRPTEVNDDVKRKQKNVFTDQIALAAELDLPLVIHSRPSKGTQDAYADVITLLTEAKRTNPNIRGDIHFFVGGIPEAEAFIALGFTLSFTAVITFARDYDEVIRTVPLESILSETDAPYVAPLRRRGQRNDSLSVKDVVDTIAEIRQEDREVVRTTLVENAQRLFSLYGSDRCAALVCGASAC
jgi:TatD DNase family protein